MPQLQRLFLLVIFHIMSTIEDLQKIEVRIGTVQSAEKIPDADKLIRLVVDFGEEKPRQIISGITSYVPEPESLVGKQYTFITNLEPRTIFGYESQGMLFAIGKQETFSFLVPERSVPPGTRAN